MTTSVSTIHPVPSGRLHIGDDGHANPDELVACIIDADARTGSSGLAYIAEHTDARVLNKQARTARALDNADAYLAEHGATPEQAAAMAEIKRILGLPVPYVVPTDCGEAARITAAGARGAILSAYLYTPEWEGEPEGPTRLSVYSEPSNEGELDLAGARDFRAQLVEFLPKLDAMIDALAVAEQDGAC